MVPHGLDSLGARRDSHSSAPPRPKLETPSSQSSEIDCEKAGGGGGVIGVVEREGRLRIFLAVNHGPGSLSWGLPASQAGCPARAVPGSSLPQWREWHLDCAFPAGQPRPQEFLAHRQERPQVLFRRLSFCDLAQSPEHEGYLQFFCVNYLPRLAASPEASLPVLLPPSLLALPAHTVSPLSGSRSLFSHCPRSVPG